LVLRKENLSDHDSNPSKDPSTTLTAGRFWTGIDGRPDQGRLRFKCGERVFKAQLPAISKYLCLTLLIRNQGWHCGRLYKEKLTEFSSAQRNTQATGNEHLITVEMYSKQLIASEQLTKALQRTATVTSRLSLIANMLHKLAHSVLSS